MSSIGIKLPINRDSVDGFLMLKTIKETIQQNFKMLVLTNPGERVMEPNFGVGVTRLLFSGYHEGVETVIRNRVTEQAGIYIPAVEVISVDFSQTRDFNTLSVFIRYTIPRIGLDDTLQITI